MSDVSQGPGWWVASDGKWYPPDQAPAVPPAETWAPPPQPPPSGGMSSGAKGALIAGAAVVGLLVMIGLGALFLGSDSTSTHSSTGSATSGDGGSDGGAATADPGGATLPDGYTSLDGDGVSIGAPEGWQPIDAEDFAMDPEDFAAAFPDAPAEMLDQGAQFFEQGAVLVAFEMGSGTYPSNVNILDIPGEAPLGLVESQAKSQIESLDGELVDSGRVDLPVGEALRMEYGLGVALPDGSTLPSKGVQYYIPLDGRTYIVTISSARDVADLADAMAETFRVT